MLWNENGLLEKLKANSQTRFWRLAVKNLKRKEFYLIQEGESSASLDQERVVEQKVYSLTLVVDKDADHQGSASTVLSPLEDLDAQVAALLKTAESAGEKKWDLPESSGEVTNQSEQLYAPLKENFNSTANKMSQDFLAAIAQTEGGKFNSAELFVSQNSQTTYLSNGFKGYKEWSNLYAEVCFSVEENGVGHEYLMTRFGAHPEQLKFSEMCKTSVEYAQALHKAEPMPSGQYSVKMDSRSLTYVFEVVLEQLNLQRKYYQLPYFKEGQDFIKNFSGEPFRMLMKSSQDYSFSASDFDGWGQKQSDLLLVEGNQVKNYMLSEKFAQYLGLERTSHLGVCVIEAEGKGFQEQLQECGPVLEVLEFSSLFPSANDLTFSSEVRLAKLHDPKTGEVKYFRGGNLSGNFVENFAKISWSKEGVTENVFDTFVGTVMTYSGPSYAILNDVAVSS
jgi:hypothetical protein